jgi:hypothetical protein
MSQDNSAATHKPGKPAIQKKSQPPVINSELQALFKGISAKELIKPDPKPDFSSTRVQGELEGSTPLPSALENGRTEIKQRKMPS